MGLMDKVKAQAEQAVAKAQKGMQQGQEKIEEMQAKRHADALLRNLGAAYYAQQRSGGSADAVTAALAAVDAHAKEHGAIDTAITVPSESSTPTMSSGEGSSDEGSSGAGSTGEGSSYNLDDV